MTEKVRESMRRLAEAHATIREEAPDIERQILDLDEDISRALLEDDDDNPLSRRLAWRVTQWAQNGWFPSSWETPLALITQTAELLGTKHHEQVESAIASHFERNAEKFINTVIDSHSSRTHI